MMMALSFAMSENPNPVTMASPPGFSRSRASPNFFLQNAPCALTKRLAGPHMSFDTRAFRQALGSFPTGVAVVTAAPAQSHPLGITVNSFTSVSLDPPLILWCLDRGSDRYHTFTKAAGYTVSVLGTAHEEVSARLAKQGAHHLDGIELLPTELGPPALADALAIFECTAEAAHEGGDHVILVGRVVRFARREAGAPLIFFRGRYGALG
jgi:4-hydroxyphenylacetate 3-hydroxylase, reductase component